MLTDGFFKKLTYWGLKNYYKRSDGDAIGLIAQGGQQLKYHPIVYVGEDECEEGEKPGWHAVGSDKSWEAASEGRVVDHLGRTPIVLLERDSHIEAGWLKPRIGEAIELDRYDPVFSNAQIDAVFDVDPGGQPPQQAARPPLAGRWARGSKPTAGSSNRRRFAASRSVTRGCSRAIRCSTSRVRTVTTASASVTQRPTSG
jgi:hypothetical protein